MGKWIIQVKCVKEKNEQGGMARQGLPGCPGGLAGEGREESQCGPGDIRAGGLVLGLPQPLGSFFPLPLTSSRKHCTMSAGGGKVRRGILSSPHG